ncbi:hypothetical protein SAMN05216188_116200 [Lentzea xinjiangensis]|uniref:Uncharacterized protein n=1 Tax=Lentzea xinjiangensis TaxID=402600 RepID=A0A1H9SPX6_9PSEU|nr:hypothetical protein [Lentzea xinjiangensis]SER87060.1 hypothetical protein SAMN05216188_116200 [Lentzea xinjiangensis]
MRMRKVMAAALTGLALIGLAGTASAGTSSADYPWPPKDVTPVHKTKAELQEQADAFTAHQQRTYPRVFRGSRDVTPGNWGGEAEGVFDDMQYMGNTVTFTYQGQDVTTFTQVNAPGTHTWSPQEYCERTAECTGSASDHRGGLIVFARNEQFGITSARNFRPNGEVVWVQSWTPGTEAQLAVLVSDRAYTFTR